jgi:N-acyl-L-homoserine lactone synthetase
VHAINIENAHEFGSVLPQLHRLRYRQFKERQSYDVPVYNGMEYDRYDTLATVHLIWLDEARIVRGCSRLLPNNPKVLSSYRAHSLRLASVSKTPVFMRVWSVVTAATPTVAGGLR